MRGAVLSTITRSYDQLGRMTRYTDAGGGWTDYEFDEYGKPTQFTDSLGTTRRSAKTARWNPKAAAREQ